MISVTSKDGQVQDCKSYKLRLHQASQDRHSAAVMVLLQNSTPRGGKSDTQPEGLRKHIDERVKELNFRTWYSNGGSVLMKEVVRKVRIKHYNTGKRIEYHEVPNDETIQEAVEYFDLCMSERPELFEPVELYDEWFWTMWGYKVRDYDYVQAEYHCHDTERSVSARWDEMWMARDAVDNGADLKDYPGLYQGRLASSG